MKRAIAILVATVVVNALNLTEAFDVGPPYYGGRENMDKWENPIPALIMMDIVAIAVVVLIARWGLHLGLK